MKFMKWQSQILKGSLEFIILLVLEKNECYGYELIKKIKSLIDIEASEGTVYPILNRLKNLGLVTSRWEHRETGVPRKYYSITDQGKKMLTEMKTFWMKFTDSINNLMEK